MKTHETFLTTSARGLNHNHPALKMFQKAKRLGTWDPMAIDLSQDIEDWKQADPIQRDAFLRLVSMFQAGEESVTLDLLPLIQVVASEGRIEEEMFLTSFLWEEAKHVEFMSRLLGEVAGVSGEDLSRYHTPSYRALFYEALPQAMHRLTYDTSLVAQAEASVTYNMIVEGVLAETGYYAFFRSCKERGIMPGLVKGIGKMMQDESRHIAFGVYFLSRLIHEHGDPAWEAIQNRMNELLPVAMGVVQEGMEAYEEPPFGIPLEEMMAYAINQYTRRENRLARARNLSLEQLYDEAEAEERESAQITSAVIGGSA